MRADPLTTTIPTIGRPEMHPAWREPMPASSSLGPYDSDRGSLARETRVQEVEQLERRASVMAALAVDLELQAETTTDDRLSAALDCLAYCAEELSARLIRETEL